jgi:hypothetical protein
VRQDTGTGAGSGTGHSSSRDAGMDTGRDAGEATDGGTCVPSAPDGWAGPFAIQVETAGDAGLPALAQCPASYDGNPVFDGLAQPDETPASCGCSCDAPTGLVCSATLSTFGDDACSMGEMSGPAPTMCMPMPGNTRAVTISPSSLTGNCQAVGQPVSPPPSWTREVRLCSPGQSLAACEGGRVIVPPPGAPYAAANYCVTSATETACPNAYQTAHVFYPFATGGSSGLMDTRSCHCNCSAPVADAGCAPGTVLFIEFGSCTGATQQLGTGTQCTALGFVGAAQLMPAPSPPAACTPSQVSTGMVTPMGKPTTTVCCLE